MTYSLYIHIPFCRHRCAYCDFNTYAGQEDSIPAYVEALKREIEFVAASAQEKLNVHTVFFGGGTPSLLSAAQFEVILEAIRRRFDVTANAEITTEANPGTVSPRALGDLRRLGINRISFGAQSANGEELRMLERTHSFLDVIEAVTAARRAGFDNLNLDLIYGLPQQELGTWKTTVRRVLNLHPEHISAYALTLEHGTPFGKWSARGLLPSPDPDAAAEMYEWASEEFEAAGYEQYEISNWGRTVDGLTRDAKSGTAGIGEEETRKSKDSNRQLSSWPKNRADGMQEPGFACRHNLQYWRGLPYLGLGAGAHGYANGYRYSNALRIATYIGRLQEPIFENGKPGIAAADGGEGAVKFPLTPSAVNQHRQTVQDDMSEFMITGLRLTREGVSQAVFHDRFGRDLMAVYGSEVNELIGVGLLEGVKNGTSEAAGSGIASDVLRLTKRGRLLGNQVFLRFV